MQKMFFRDKKSFRESRFLGGEGNSNTNLTFPLATGFGLSEMASPCSD